MAKTSKQANKKQKQTNKQKIGRHIVFHKQVRRLASSSDGNQQLHFKGRWCGRYYTRHEHNSPLV